MKPETAVFETAVNGERMESRDGKRRGWMCVMMMETSPVGSAIKLRCTVGIDPGTERYSNEQRRACSSTMF